MQKFKQRILNWFRRNRKRNRPAPEDTSKDDKGDKKDTAEEDLKEIDVEIPLPPGEGEMPSYFHVGSAAKDCLITGYKLGAWQLQCTTKTNQDFYLSTFGEGYPTIDSVFGGVEALKESDNWSASLGWLTTNEYVSEVGVRAMGLGSQWYALLKSMIGTKDEVTFKSKLKCGFERNPVKVEVVVPLYNEPLLLGYVVVAPFENWLLGYRASYNMDDKGFDKHALCLGYNNGTTEIGLKLENFQDLRGSIFQRIGERWAFAIKSNLYNSENVKQFAIGVQYDFQNGSLLKAKLRHDSRIGFVYQSKLGENVDIMYHAAFDGVDPIGGNHKIGVAWHFQC
uniref:Voltage-dependent anion-selective channel n=1 Tax=Drosophila rhopaloa TaxID=1041015 RepID=A0A6P4FK52_DRORH